MAILAQPLEEAMAHLGAALIQTIPSDDQIIMDHVRTAHEIITTLVRNQRANLANTKLFNP